MAIMKFKEYLESQRSAPPVFVALDYNNKEDVMTLVSKLDPKLCGLKVGKELFTIAGPELVRDLVSKGYKVFLDLKFHDIPNTVNKAVAAAADLGVWMCNVHASGGSEMLQAAREALKDRNNPPLLTAVTVLTSMNQQGLDELGVNRQVEEHVLALAGLAQDKGIDGVVCSAAEAKLLRARLGEDFVLVTPGIRPAGSAAGDQKRIVTPSQAIADGVSYLVIGRPITQSEDPLQTLRTINEEISYKPV